MFSLFMAVCLTGKNKKSRKTPRAPPGPASSPRPRPALPLLRSHQSSGSPTRIGAGPASITPPQPAANLELRRHWSPSALLPGETEAHNGSYAQTWPKERSRNYPKCTDTPQGSRKLLGNGVSVWTPAPGEEIKITSSAAPTAGRTWCAKGALTIL